MTLCPPGQFITSAMDEHTEEFDIPGELEYGSAPYMFEPEYTDDELRETDEQAAILQEADGDIDETS